MALLEVRGLVKRFGSRTVVNGVSFDVSPGEVVGLLGPNGAGKTTSFRMATGQITPNEGMVLFDGADVTNYPMYRRARLGMGYLSQEPSVFRRLTVEQNLLAILEALPKSRTLGRKLTRAERWDRAEEALKRFNLLEVRKNSAARCSGGEKRRLEIARALVCEPLLILLDEPLAAVDPLTKEDIRKNIRELANQGIGILLTDHDVREVMKIADRAYVIIGGKVQAHGTPAQLKRDPVVINGYFGSTFEDEWRREEAERRLQELDRYQAHPLANRPLPHAEPVTLIPAVPAPEQMPPSVLFDPYLPDNRPDQPDDDPPTPPAGGPNGQSVKATTPSLTTVPPSFARTTNPSTTIRDEQTIPNPSPETVSHPTSFHPPSSHQSYTDNIAGNRPFETTGIPSNVADETSAANDNGLFGSTVPPPLSEPELREQSQPGPTLPGLMPPLNAPPSGPGQFSATTLQMIEQEKMRRAVELLTTDSWQSAWHELALRGMEAVPVLLEALERRSATTRHLAFRLLEQITGEALTFQADAADEVRLRQVAYLRAKFDTRRAA